MKDTGNMRKYMWGGLWEKERDVSEGQERER